jgi:rod shape-determining protein MreB
MFEKKIGIDLGTANVLAYVKGHGIVVREPSMVAIALGDNKIVAVGEEARTMLGRVPEAIEVLHPLRDGVIADYIVTEAMLRYFIDRIVGRFRLFRPIVMVSVPVGVTSVEERAVKDAARQASGREAYVIPEPLAAAIGAGMPIDTPTGNMVVDIGGGTSEAAVVAMYGIVVSGSVRVGGRDQVAGLPRTVKITSDEVTEAMAEPLSSVVGVVKSVLEQTPPELASDIIDRGMVLTGGGALLRNMDRLLTQETGVPCYVAENPMACVALGAGRALDIYDAIQRSMVAD